jgi:hypothetical protein
MTKFFEPIKKIRFYRLSAFRKNFPSFDIVHLHLRLPGDGCPDDLSVPLRYSEQNTKEVTALKKQLFYNCFHTFVYLVLF